MISNFDYLHIPKKNPQLLTRIAHGISRKLATPQSMSRSKFEKRKGMSRSKVRSTAIQKDDLDEDRNEPLLPDTKDSSCPF